MADRYRPFVEGSYYKSHEGKQAFLRDIFDRTAPYYERISTWGWLWTGDAYRRWALRRAGVKPHMQVIDVASGTGAVARALLSIVDDPSQVVCVEPSAGMIAESRKTVPCRHYQATADALPVADASQDFLTMGFALRHVTDLKQSFSEYRRVLRDGGKVLIMDVTMPRSTLGKAIFALYFKHSLPALSFLMTWDRDTYRLMKYYWETMEQMIPNEEVAAILTEAGFSKVSHRAFWGCFAEFEAVR